MKRTKRVTLNLEESGWLCNLLAGEMSPWVTGKLICPSWKQPILKRQMALYERLSTANDKMMRINPGE